MHYDTRTLSPLETLCAKTYFHNLDLAAAGLLLSEFETETAHALRNNIRPPFYQRLALCINEVETDYDIVVIDCPPQLGFTTLSAFGSVDIPCRHCHS